MLENVFSPSADRSSAEGFSGELIETELFVAEVAVEEGTCTSASAQGRQGLLQLAPSASDQQILMRLLVLKENTWLHVASVYKSGFAGCTSQRADFSLV